jgi:FkbM family methyltransferase
MREKSAEKIGLKHSPLQRQSKYRLVQTFAKSLQVHKILDRFLRRHPVRRKLPQSGLTYRIASYSSWLMAQELFTYSVYRPALADGFRRSTFLDLGSHAGYFPLLLAEISPGNEANSRLQGICIDANPEMAEETGWHLQTNHLRGIRARHGLVGGGNLESKPFYLNSTSFLSSAFAQRHPGQKLSDPLETVDVPVLDVEKLWKEEFGNRQIDLLKIDIEGSELDLIRQNPGLLLQSNRLIIECHKWLVPEAEVLGRVDALGFRVLLRLNEDQDSVVIVCER